VKRQLAERSGREGERRAAFWLRAKGWRILATRVKTPRGEIDLVAKRGGVIAFVEVKWRRKSADLDLAIDEHRLARVAAAVECVAHDYATEGEDIRHIANAWMP
jgi:putative endonuclease